MNSGKIYLRLLLLELLNKDSIKSALEQAGKKEFYKKILDLDPTKDKNATYSVKLTKFFLEPRSSNDNDFFTILSDYFKKFLLLKNKKVLKGKDSDLNSIKSFDAFHNLIDAALTQLMRQKSSDRVSTINIDKPAEDNIKALNKIIDKKDITYIDDNAIVIRADNPSKSKRYGGGFSAWCTARKTGNLFYSYRFDKNETMYYVYFLKKDKNDDELVLHFGIDEDGDISYTDRTNRESTQNLRWLANKFPELKPAIDNNAFKVIPFTESEKRIKEMPDKLTAEQFESLTYEEKEMWLLAENRDVTIFVWNLMDDNFRNLYIRDFSDRDDDLDVLVYSAIRETKYEKLYYNVILKRIEDNLTESNGVLDFCTLHEFNIIKTKPRIILKLTDNCVSNLMRYSLNKDEIAKTIISVKGDNLSDDNVSNLMRYSSNKDEIAKTIISVKGNNLSDDNVSNLMRHSKNKDEIAKTIISVKGNNLSDDNVSNLMRYSLNKDEMVKTIINLKGNNLSDDSVRHLITHSLNRYETAKTIINLKGNNLSDDNVLYLMAYSKNKDEIAKKLSITLSPDKLLQIKNKFPHYFKQLNEQHLCYKKYFMI